MTKGRMMQIQNLSNKKSLAGENDYLHHPWQQSFCDFGFSLRYRKASMPPQRHSNRL
jgi:hypothetical protein